MAISSMYGHVVHAKCDVISPSTLLPPFGLFHSVNQAGEMIDSLQLTAYQN